MPSTWSRIAPQATRRGPDRLVATMPPMVCGRSGALQQSAARSGGSAIRCWPSFGERGLDFRQRRAGAGGDDQLLRRIERDAGVVAVDRLRAACTGRSMPSLGAVAADQQRLAGRGRVGDGGGDGLLVGRHRAALIGARAWHRC